MKELASLPIARRDFPKDFLWGASVAAYQVEGGTYTQWTKWEHDNATRLAERAHHDAHWLPSWERIQKQAKDPLNYIAGNAVEHYKLYKKDHALASELGLNAMRVGIEWARICPDRYTIDENELAHYNNYIQSMHKQKLSPVINLFHWTEPLWFSEQGGFSKRSNMRYWRKFVAAVVDSLDLSGVSYILTINEANTYSNMGYLNGAHAPGLHRPLQAIRVYKNLAAAHRAAYRIIKRKYPHIQIGFAHQYNKVISTNILGRPYAALQRWYWNYAWIQWCRKFDFVGFNYYFADYWTGKIKSFDINREPPVSDLGWHMEPSGVEWVINDIVKRFPGKPIMITENGLADAKDQYREWWIAETITSMKRCIDKGLPLIGYMHWSLLDNFEWQYGWWPKFGLVRVDRPSMKRTVRQSAKSWAKWLRVK